VWPIKHIDVVVGLGAVDGHGGEVPKVGLDEEGLLAQKPRVSVPVDLREPLRKMKYKKTRSGDPISLFVVY